MQPVVPAVSAEFEQFLFWTNVNFELFVEHVQRLQTCLAMIYRLQRLDIFGAESLGVSMEQPFELAGFNEHQTIWKNQGRPVGTRDMDGAGQVVQISYLVLCSDYPKRPVTFKHEFRAGYEPEVFLKLSKGEIVIEQNIKGYPLTMLIDTKNVFKGVQGQMMQFIG